MSNKGIPSEGMPRKVSAMGAPSSRSSLAEVLGSRVPLRFAGRNSRCAAELCQFMLLQ